MCVVSMITDHYRDKWPVVTPDLLRWPGVQQSQPYLIPSIQITLEQWQEYQKLKRDAEAYDQRTKQPECVKPEVADWEAAVEKVLRQRGIIKD